MGRLCEACCTPLLSSRSSHLSSHSDTPKLLNVTGLSSCAVRPLVLAPSDLISGSFGWSFLLGFGSLLFPGSSDCAVLLWLAGLVWSTNTEAFASLISTSCSVASFSVLAAFLLFFDECKNSEMPFPVASTIEAVIASLCLDGSLKMFEIFEDGL